MNRDRIVQLIAPIVMIISLAASGMLLPGILQRSDRHVLRYTNVSVDGAPPIVVLGTAIGAVRGLIVDYLWVKANLMKDKGLFYEAMADADLITKLQPRFASVWTFQGHNMAYNISVATNSPQERWTWVNAGINLVRNKGLRYNPNNMEMHRELAFWFAHKIEGVSDDAHLYYKAQLCKEWHLLLGAPPEDYEAYLAWMKEVADAPETLEAAEQRTPGVTELVERLRAAMKKLGYGNIQFDQNFVVDYTGWQEVRQRSAAAKLLGKEAEFRKRPNFVAFDEIASDPNEQKAWATLIAYARKRVLEDQYNMDPQLMYRYAVELKVPIDWRNGQAHALYWSRRGAEFGAGRLSDDDIYISLNNDSQQMQAMQDLAHFGRISYDPFSTEMPGRFPEPRWIDTIDDNFEYFYAKHYDVRGAGGERFSTFLQNFLSSAICEWFHAGETARAEKLLKRLDTLFGAPGPMSTSKYKVPVADFVHDETFDQYQAQPHLAPQDVAASLTYGYNVGIGANRPEVLVGALQFATQVTDWFKKNKYYDYKDKYGEARVADILLDLQDSSEIIYLQLMEDPTIKLEHRVAIWKNTDRVESEVVRDHPDLLGRSYPAFRALVYDRLMQVLQQQFAMNELSKQFALDDLFPAPPGLEQQRAFLAQRDEQRQKERDAIRKRDPFASKGGG